MRLIDADALKAYFHRPYSNEESYTNTDLDRIIDNAPTIKTFTLADIEAQYRKGLEKGLEERPHGEWIECEDDRHFFRCSKCGNVVLPEEASKYCGECGADMRKEGDKK